MIRWWCCLTVSDVIYSHSSHHTKRTQSIFFAQTISYVSIFNTDFDVLFVLVWFALDNEWIRCANISFIYSQTHWHRHRHSNYNISKSIERFVCAHQHLSVVMFAMMMMMMRCQSLQNEKKIAQRTAPYILILQKIKNNRLNWNGQCTICIHRLSFHRARTSIYT